MNTGSSYLYLSHYYNNSTPGYGGRKDFELSQDKCISHGDKCNQVHFKMTNHVGTHMDLPYHFDNAGKKLNDYSPADWIFSKVSVVDIPLQPGELLNPFHFTMTLDPSTEFLIVKTFFEKYRQVDTYWNNNPGLSSELAQYLRSHYKKLRVIGFDFISATSYTNKEEGRKAHLAFLGSEQGTPLLIIEDMALAALKPGQKLSWVHVSPLLLDQADGIPVTITAQISEKAV